MNPHDDWRESQLSALFDDELLLDDAEQCLQNDAQTVLDRWCDYEDVRAAMKGELTTASSHAFLQAFRARVAEVQPVSVVQAVPVAQAMQPAANDSVFRWKLVAGLASCAAVAVMAWTAVGGRSATPAPAVAQVSPSFGAPYTRVQGFALPVRQAALAPLADGEAAQREVMLRDPALDEFLRAHGAQAGAMALENTSGFMRNATYGGDGL